MQATLACTSPVPLGALWRVLVPSRAATTEKPADDSDPGSHVAAVAECDQLNSLQQDAVTFVAVPDADLQSQAICHKVQNTRSSTTRIYRMCVCSNGDSCSSGPSISIGMSIWI